ncbi:MAG: PAS domain-containing protein [Candidatus Nitrohelix vancouverensis]|uniref:histidine kinase n=1 Tax=Candidatus Nitrohelix vancouverensis TaxID=2705534 RepID=A0A7T0G307_9BACT|nr:MAG: PAS domain-containing protein [Candidatus Nitrohelix vancouverensis]
MTKRIKTIDKKFLEMTFVKYAITALTIMALIISSGFYVLNSVQNHLKNNITENLSLSLNTTLEVFEIWVKEKKGVAYFLMNEDQTQKNILSILEKTQDNDFEKNDLLALEEAIALKNHLAPIVESMDFVGYVLFNTSGRQVAALLDSAVGENNLMGYSDFFSRSLKGEVCLSLPFISEINLVGEDGKLRPGMPTMFISYPVKNLHDEIIGVMAFRLKPETEFSKIFMGARTGSTGEAYAFSKDGRMLSDTRFLDHLRAIGIIPNELWSHSLLAVNIRNPGGNLVEGFTPETPPDQWPLTFMAAEATQGNSGVNVEGYNDYRGVPVVGAWTWLPEYDMGFTKEIDLKEAYSAVNMLQALFYDVLIGLCLLTAISVWSFWKRKRADINLSISNKYYKAVIKSSIDPIIFTDMKGVILSFNPSAERVFKFSASEIIGKDISHIISDSDNQQDNSSTHASVFNQIFAKVRDKSDPHLWGVSKNKERFPIEIRASKVKIDAGAIICCIISDISDIVESRQKNLEITNQLEILLNSIAEGVCRLDMNGKVYFMNPSASKILGFQETEAIGQDFFSLVQPIGRNGRSFIKSREHLAQIIREGNLYESVEDEFHKNTGEIFDAEFTLAPIKRDDETLGCVLTFKDIGVRKKREALMIKLKEEAEQASKAKSEFLSRMSHELRTPMNAILGFAQLTYNNPNQSLTPDQKENIMEICKAGERLLFLINEVLELSEIDKGDISLSMEPVCVSSLLNDVADVMKQVAVKNSIELINEVSMGQSVFAYADRIRLKQVLMNLLSNGIKYTPAGGKVWLRCEVNSETTIRISVKDTGVGIPEELQSRLFQPFDRLNADNGDVEGTGIGLTLCKRLTELMKGSICFENCSEGGSCFSVELQKAEATDLNDPTPENVDEALIENSGESKKIIYIEDNPANHRLMEKLFSGKKGFDLLTAHEGGIGIDLAMATLPDLILMDINLPGMDGYSTLRTLKRLSETKNIPVIALSAKASEKDIERALLAGFNHFVPKPIDIDKLFDLIESELRSI